MPYDYRKTMPVPQPKAGQIVRSQPNRTAPKPYCEPTTTRQNPGVKNPDR